MEKEDFQEFIKNCEEYELFFTIDEAGSFIYRMRQALSNGVIPETDVDGVNQDVIAINKMQGDAAAQTIRFGVDFKLIEQFNDLLKKNITMPCPEYWKWMKYWNDWRGEFTDETWGEFSTALNNKESVAQFLPKKKWNED